MNHLQSGTISGSMSRDQRDHSICTAVIGRTACARLMVSGLASDNPIYLTFPSSTNFLSSPICNDLEQRIHMSKHTNTADCFKAGRMCRQAAETVSSMGIVVSMRCW